MSEISETITDEPARGKPGQAARNSLGTLITRVLLLPLTAVVSIVVARVLGAENRGIFAFLLLCNGFAMPLLILGFDVAVIYFISCGQYRIRDVGWTCVIVGLITGLFAALLIGGLWSANCLGTVAEMATAAVMVPVLCVLPLQGAELMLNRLMVGASNFRFTNTLILISETFRTVALLVVVAWLGFGLGGAVAVVLASEIVRFTWALVGVWRAHQPSFKVDLGFIQKAYSYGWRASLAVFAKRVNLRFDQVVIAAIGDASALGVYSITLRFAELFWLIPDSIGTVMFNKIAAERDDVKRIQLVDQVHRSLITIVGLSATVAAVVGFWFLPWALGPDFADSPVLLTMLLPGTIGLISIKVISKYFGATGRPLMVGVAQILGVAVSIPLYLVMIPAFGVRGAAIASSIAYIAVALIAIAIFRSQIAPNKTHMFRISASDLRWAWEQVRQGLRRRRVQA